MYQIGDIIIYGKQGVFKIEDIGVPDMSYINKDKLYYTLSAVHYSNTIYTPVDTSVFMRPVITYDEAQELIRRMPEIKADVFVDGSIRMLSDHYNNSLESHDCSDLIQLIKEVYIKRIMVTEKGKTLGQTDEKFMKKAEDLLYGEFAVVLGMPKEDVKGYIEETVEKILNEQK